MVFFCTDESFRCYKIGVWIKYSLSLRKRIYKNDVFYVVLKCGLYHKIIFIIIFITKSLKKS